MSLILDTPSGLSPGEGESKLPIPPTQSKLERGSQAWNTVLGPYIATYKSVDTERFDLWRNVDQKGLFTITASTDLTHGDEIFIEAPLLFVAPDQIDEKQSELLKFQLETTTHTKRGLFYSLPNVWGGKYSKTAAIAKTWCLPVENRLETYPELLDQFPNFPESVTAIPPLQGIFPYVAKLFPHSCNPNAIARLFSSEEHPLVISIRLCRSVSADEPITLNWLHKPGTFQNRQVHYRAKFNKPCGCDKCHQTLVPAAKVKSDTSLKLLEAMLKRIAEDAKTSNTQVLPKIRKAFELLGQEEVRDETLGDLYWNAFMAVKDTSLHQTRGLLFLDAARKKFIGVFGEENKLLDMEKINKRIDDVPIVFHDYFFRFKQTLQHNHDVYMDWVFSTDDSAIKHSLWTEFADLRDETIFLDACTAPYTTNVEDTWTKGDCPARHWAMIVEALDQTRVDWNGILVEDRLGIPLMLSFNGIINASVRESMGIKKGTSLIVLYPVLEEMKPVGIGIRAIGSRQLLILPSMPMDFLLGFSDKVQEFATARDDQRRVCFGCARVGDDLQMCHQCNLFWFCNAECQEVGWTVKGHRADCNRIGHVTELFLAQWRVFDGLFNAQDFLDV